MAKKTINPAQAKQAKQKKILIVGGVLFVLLLAVQGPKTMKRLHGGSSGPDWRTADAAAAASATPPAGLVAPTLSGTPTTVATTTDEGPLASEKPPTAAVGQLATFDTRFASKDPFASQAPTAAPKATTPPTPPTPPSSSGSGSVVPGSDGSGSSSGSSSGGSSTPSASRASAVIAVNGVQELVSVSADFPAAQPTFHLKSLSAHSAQITIAGGKYADGAQALTLEEGKAVTLMNTADGTRYKLQLYPEGTKPPAAPTTTGTTTTAATPVVPAAPAATTTTAAATTTAKTTTP